MTRQVRRLNPLARRLRLDRLFGQRSDLVLEPTDVLLRYKATIDLAASQAKIGVWECDLASGALSWTDGVYALFELPPQLRVTRAGIVAFYHPESRNEMERLRTQAIQELGCFSLDARITTAKGNLRWIRLTANVEAKNGVAIRLFGMKQDITDEKAALDRLRELAETDLLTGLANRSVFQARLETWTAPREAPHALMLIDLDGFKQVNDRFGHLAGDECLRQVGARLTQICGPDALVARIGGDEFAICLDLGCTRRRIDEIVERVLDEVPSPIDWQRQHLTIGASIGVAVLSPSTACDPTRLLEDADVALYAAKTKGKNRLRIFTPDLRPEAAARTGANGLDLGETESQLELNWPQAGPPRVERSIAA